MTTAFPDTADFVGLNEPVRVEWDACDLIVEGAVPSDIDGVWYRLTPDPQYPPMLGDDTFISGDGSISAVRFHGGRVDFKTRYVLTDRFLAERRSRRSLHGLYRNPFTDDPSVRGMNRGVANTTPFYHAGKLFALKEDSLPVEVDPVTLVTIGSYDFGGSLRSVSMTAHPRTDPATGEMHFYGYEAAGPATRDIAYAVADRDGRLIREEWFEAPYAALMHDFVITSEYVVFPFFPITASLERLEAGGAHWVWEPEKGTIIAIMPRDGSAADIKWFRSKACSVFHFVNAFSENGRVYVDACKFDTNPFPFIARASGYEHDMRKLGGGLVRWTFDMNRPGDSFDEQVLAPAGDVPRVAERDCLVDYNVAYIGRYDPEIGPPLNAGPLNVGFNSLWRIEINGGRSSCYAPGPRFTINEPVHIEASEPEHEGYLAVVVDDHDTYSNEIHVLRAAHLDEGPIARIRVPVRLRPQVHGNWVPAGVKTP